LECAGFPRRKKTKQGFLEGRAQNTLYNFQNLPTAKKIQAATIPDRRKKHKKSPSALVEKEDKNLILDAEQYSTVCSLF
jgi:hypothetical protein